MLITSNTYEKKKKKVLRQVLPGESQNKLIAHVPRDWPQWSPVLLISDDLWVKWKLQMFQHSPHQAQAASHQHRDVACVSAWQGAQWTEEGLRSPTVQQGRLKFLSLADPLEGAEDAGEHSAVIRRSVHQRAVVLISCFCCIQALPSALVVSAASQHVLHTHTHTDAVVSYRETAAQEKHSHVNVMYKIFSNGGENKHNTTLFELVVSTSTLI